MISTMYPQTSMAPMPQSQPVQQQPPLPQQQQQHKPAIQKVIDHYEHFQ